MSPDDTPTPTPTLRTGRRRRLGVLAGPLAIALAAGLSVSSNGGGGGSAPATGAARLVPADALVYVHLSTDRDRDGVKRMLALAGRFPSLPTVRDALFKRLSSSGQTLSQRDVDPWLGDEAALALLNTSGTTAGSLLVVAVSDRAKAEAFLRRNAGAATPDRYRGSAISAFGSVSTAFVGSYLVIGPADSVRLAIDRESGRGPALAGDGTYRRAIAGLPDDRALDIYASQEGVRRLLSPQPGLIGAAGALLDHPGLAGVSLGLSAEGDKAKLRVHSVTAPGGSPAPSPFQPFEPKLAAAVPKDALAYLGLTGLDRAAGRLISLGTLGGSAGVRIGTLLARARSDLEKRAGVNIARDVLPLFRGEVALWLSSAVPAPILTLTAHTGDEKATRLAFAKLQAPLAKLFAPPNRGAGQVPTFEERSVQGTPTFSLHLATGLELDYAIFDGKLVISTSVDGIAAVRRSKGALAGSSAFEATAGQRPKRVTSLVFLDFSQLLSLAERTGLRDSAAYGAVANDLKKIRALGAVGAGGKDDSTTELTLLIP